MRCTPLSHLPSARRHGRGRGRVSLFEVCKNKLRWIGLHWLSLKGFCHVQAHPLPGIHDFGLDPLCW